MASRQLRDFAMQRDWQQKIMQKPNVRGPSPSRKAQLVLRGKLNLKSKPRPTPPGASNVMDKTRRGGAHKSAYGKI